MIKRIVSSGKVQYLFAGSITIINIFALTLADAMQENISHIANVNEHPYFVILWASSFALYLALYTSIFMKQVQYRNTLGKYGCYVACEFMVISVLIPYRPDEFPRLATLHIQLSMVSTLLYAIIFLHILYKSYFYDIAYTLRILPFYLMIIGCCGVMFLLMGCVSTLLEVFFVIAMSWYLGYLVHPFSLHKKNN